MKLNPQQQKAVEILEGPVLVLAGAGAGKTLTLTQRIINLIENGVAPQNILAITFTNKAAGEMKERVYKALKNNKKLNFPVLDRGFLPFVATFHSLGVYILKDNYRDLGISKYFSIYDRADSRRALKEAYRILDLDPKEFEPKMVFSVISKNKGNFIDHQKFSKMAQNNFSSETIAKIWNEYEKIKKADSALDFDDLLLITAKFLEENEERRRQYQKKWTHIHIDEYQDTNKVQYKIAEFLTCPKKKNIFAVGDPDQLIYSWRGAELSNIMSFEKDFPGGKMVLLEQNYRSTKNIIESSNAVIEKNKNRFDKKLFTDSESGDKVTLYSAFSEKDEANFIAQKAEELIKIKTNPNEIAVLYRANFQSRILEEAFLKRNIPYQVLGTKFFDRAEVKDMMSYIKAAFNPNSLVDIKRVINSPKRGIGKTSIVKIFSGEVQSLPKKAKNSYEDFLKILENIKKYSENKTPRELVLFVIEESGLEKLFSEKKTDEDLERLSNIYELAEFAKKYDSLSPEEGLHKFLEDVALMSDQDTKKDEEKKPTVKLMTIHAAKGLEFENVFLSGAEDALFSPMEMLLSKSEKNEKLEEERRLFYVAMTRAKKKLFITWANTRTIFGKSELNLICSFVLDIPGEILEEESLFSNSSSDTNYLDLDTIIFD